MGRFFIALIGQAVQERAVIPEDRRRSTFLYVDEAHDYFDDNLENLINQLRKYNVGLIMAHQNLGQLSSKLKDTVMASTTTKMVGGLSASDAAAFAREMGFDESFVKGQAKEKEAHGSESLLMTATDRRIVQPPCTRRTSPANPHHVDRCASRVRHVRPPHDGARSPGPARMRRS